MRSCHSSSVAQWTGARSSPSGVSATGYRSPSTCFRFLDFCTIVRPLPDPMLPGRRSTVARVGAEDFEEVGAEADAAEHGGDRWVQPVALEVDQENVDAEGVFGRARLDAGEVDPLLRELVQHGNQRP